MKHSDEDPRGNSPQPSPGGSSTRTVAITILKWALIAFAVVLLGREITRQWVSVRETLLTIPLWSVAFSLILAGAAVAASGEQQRGLLVAMGHHLRASEWFRVFFLSQLGKYVPGTAWAYVSQMELSRSKGIRRSTSVAVMLLGAAMTVLMSFTLGSVSIGESTVAWLPTWLRAVAAVLGTVGMLFVTARPELIGRMLQRLPERFHVGESDLSALPTLWKPTLWTGLASLFYGFHILVLSMPSSGFSWDLAAQSLGGFATAWVVGFLAFLVPAGVGVREVVLAAFLAPTLGGGGALAVVVVSRFVIIIAEAVLMAATPLFKSRIAG